MSIMQDHVCPCCLVSWQNVFTFIVAAATVGKNPGIVFGFKLKLYHVNKNYIVFFFHSPASLGLNFISKPYQGYTLRYSYVLIKSKCMA